MAQLKSRAQGGQPPSGSELALQAAECLADLEGATGWCTGSTINFRLPCTGTKEITCQISDHLSTWNEFLWPARLELRNQSGDPGQLSMVTIHEPCLPAPKKHEIRLAAALAHQLLKTHSCVTALNVSAASFKRSEPLFRDALQGNPSVTSLKVHFSTLLRHKDVCSAIPSLVNLQELELEAASEGPVAFGDSLAQVLRSATMLTTLRVPKLHMKGRAANEFLAALAATSNLKELSLRGTVIDEAFPEYRAMFSRYIATSRSLEILTVRAYNEVRQNSLKWVLEGLMENRTVTDASLTGLIMDFECATLMTDVLTRNKVLRRLHFSIFTFDTWIRRLGGCAVSSTADCDSWLLALPDNEILEAVTLPLLICETEMWDSLFKALSEKKSRMKLTISGHYSERYSWEKVCEALVASGAEKNVAFDTTFDLLYKNEMLKCRGFSEFYAFPCQDTRDEVYRTFLQLPSISNITSAHLEIWLPDVDEKLTTAIAGYIRTATTLRKLHMTVWLRYIFTESTKMCWALISKSLHQNTSVKQLRVGVRCMDEEDVELLVNAVRRSRNIRRVHLTAAKPDVAVAFVRNLRVGIENNYQLVNVTVDGCEMGIPKLAGDLFAVRCTARRNAGLVVSASRFMSGAVEDRYRAQALERVARHPALLEELADIMSVSAAEAAALVRRRIQLIEGMDNFMRLAGVVRERVQCLATEDGCIQLDNLNEDCWLLIRRYLMLEDIKE